ncbi:S8 family peptidase [Paenibacillus sp. ACRRX]|uniref:S8 family peptidase n=1 Tax=Paenibacillus sp. ACRRX TaxID=2918206 RepID=UPI001EF3F32F|nr:S8 family peptidase [Paenibacillus sp. ACRRX]MCG7409347.1 S8 family peptidase [Paenibacillus sp. ACRRX]
MDQHMFLPPVRIVDITNNKQEIPPGVSLISAPALWEESQRGDGVVIAILDSGCQVDHPDLCGRIVSGRNFTNDGGVEDYTDQSGHGTHIAGTIAANLNNYGVAGVAPEADLLILKVIGSDGSARIQQVVDAVDYAIAWRNGPQRVRVISMSLGSTHDNAALHEAIKRAVAADIAVICSAGNEGDNCADTIEISYPGAYPETLCVGAIDIDLNMAPFTNTNETVDLVAPGNEILSTWMDGKYAVMSGTSMAVPHVTGAAALIINERERELERTISVQEIYEQLKKRTESLGYKRTVEGHGVLMLDT